MRYDVNFIDVYLDGDLIEENFEIGLVYFDNSYIDLGGDRKIMLMPTQNLEIPATGEP